MRAVLLLVCGCAVAVPAPAPSHPASPQAPIGRLAGPPAELRPGAVVYDEVPQLHPAPPPHYHHGS